VAMCMVRGLSAITSAVLCCTVLYDIGLFWTVTLYNSVLCCVSFCKIRLITEWVDGFEPPHAYRSYRLPLYSLPSELYFFLE
jgi:hypothetical protein